MTAARDVLIVDDEQDMADVIRAVLENEGYSCRCATNGQAALDEVAAAMPGMILLDMLMPIMSGWECARQLRETYGRALPIVIMTAAEHAEARRADVDADAVLSKPFELVELVKAVNTYLPPQRS